MSAVRDFLMASLSEDNFKYVLCLPESDWRKGEGGLRTKGCFKKSYDKKPLISIISVVYNGEKFLEETIQSVINQSYDNIEYIIIDGGSTDKTADIIKKYENRIDYWVSEKDSGIYNAMNKGIDLSSGEWINFMNAGDLFYDNTVIENIFNTEIKEMIVFGKSLTYYKNYNVIRYDNFDFYKSLWYFSKMPNHQAIFINKLIYKNLKYDLSLKYFADTKYLREAFKNNHYKYFDKIISKFEIGGKSTYYNNFNDFINIIKDSIRLNRNNKVRQILIHTAKYLLQLILGRDRYLKFYIKRIIKK
jgi:glycosyltransferase involved in cell wall biosynthesis